MNDYNRTKSEFTELEMMRIYEFIDEFVSEEQGKVRAKQLLLSIIRYDRVIMKHTISSALNKFLTEMDRQGFLKDVNEIE